jgi:hypothetical protein
MFIFKILKQAIILSREQHKQDVEKREKTRIAKLFNDRYTYRKEWILGLERLTGISLGGIPPRGGFAWMCPDCNKIHHPIKYSALTGLHYPSCCSYPEGHRLDYHIRVE